MKKTAFDELCWQKLREKQLSTPEYLDRLKYELEVIHELKFEAVFIICHRLVTWAKQQGIRVGAGRGSAAGSLVCYILNITALDPIKYDLQFERFLIQGRVSPPDIDMDFQRDRRDEVYAHLEEMLGKDHVLRICTFNFMRTRAAIRDTARVLDIPLRNVDNILASIPYERKDEPISRLQMLPEMMHWTNLYPNLFKYASRLEGKPRHMSEHAAGVIISGTPIIDLIPIQYSPGKGKALTAWDMYDCEDAGIIKLDLLGLKTLDVMDEALGLIKKAHGIEIDIDNLVPNDPKVLGTFAQGNTKAIFQLEKDYVQELLYKTKVDKFNDLIAINALLRPGALAANAPTEYAERKHGKPFDYLHSGLVPILEPTHGLLVYQEQVMRIARELAGFSIQEADALRKAIAKLHAGTMARFKGNFFKGTAESGIGQRTSHSIWDMLKGAGTYMFNKAHSTCYSYIAYQMMYLKVYYPTEFWTATLNHEMGNETRLNHFIRLLKDRNYQILPPSAKDSSAYFAPVDRAVIRAGFLRIKGIGTKAAEQLESLTDRSSLHAWIESVREIGRRTLNKKAVEALEEAGVFYCYNVPRDEVHRELEEFITAKQARTITRLEETYLFGERPEKTKYQNIADYKAERESESEGDEIGTTNRE